MKEPKRLLEESNSSLGNDVRALLENEAEYDVVAGLEKFRALVALPPISSSETGALASDAPPSQAAHALGGLGGKFGLFGVGLVGLASALLVFRPESRESTVPKETAGALGPDPSPTVFAAVETTSAAPREEAHDIPEDGSPFEAPNLVHDARNAIGVRAVVKPNPEADDDRPTLALEMRELKEMRRFVATSPLTALELARHTRFPDGAFGPEREVVVIEALSRLGRIEEAKARATKFFAREPSHPERSRVSRLVGITLEPTSPSR